MGWVGGKANRKRSAVGRDLSKSVPLPTVLPQDLTSFRNTEGDFLWPWHRDLLLRVRSRTSSVRSMEAWEASHEAWEFKNSASQDFPGGPAVKTAASSAVHPGLILGWEVEPRAANQLRFCMPQLGSCVLQLRPSKPDFLKSSISSPGPGLLNSSLQFNKIPRELHAL